MLLESLVKSPSEGVPTVVQYIKNWTAATWVAAEGWV